MTSTSPSRACRKAGSEATRVKSASRPLLRRCRASSIASDSTSSRSSTRSLAPASAIVADDRSSRSHGWAIEDHPVQADLTDRCRELFEPHRFDDVAVGVILVGEPDVALLGGGREEHDRLGAGARVGANSPQHLEAVDLRELDVEQYQGRAVLDLEGAV